MLYRRLFLKLLCMAPLAGCITPRHIWEEFPEYGGLDIDIDTDIAKIETPSKEKPRKKPVTLPASKPVIQVIPRSSWTKAPLLSWRLSKMGKIRRITVHHEGNPKANYSESWADVVGDLRLIRRGHIRRMRAGDIGYHYIIDRRGRVWEGRPIGWQGAHAGGSNNRGNVGVMLLGNFDLQRPTDRQKTVLSAFLEKLMKKHGVSAGKIYTHRELKVTRCPGKHLQHYMQRLRRTL